MHYEAITRKQRYCQNAQAIGFKKASECNVLHFACIELYPSCIVHCCYMDWEVSFLFFSSGHSNRKIKKYYLHVAHLNREEDFFVTFRLHLTSVFSAVGMFSAVDDSQSCTDPHFRAGV